MTHLCHISEMTRTNVTFWVVRVIIRVEISAVERQRIESEGLKSAISTVATTLLEAYGGGRESRKHEAVEGAVQFLSLMVFRDTREVCCF